MHRVQTLFTSVRHPDTAGMFTANSMVRVRTVQFVIAYICLFLFYTFVRTFGFLILNLIQCPVSDLYVAFELCTRIDSALIHVAAATQQAISPEIHSTKWRPGALNAGTRSLQSMAICSR
jgi:hypothetical protein